MKKILLSAIAFTAFSFGLSAQTHSALSGNHSSTSLAGYVYQFNGSDANNCSPNWMNWFTTSGFTWTFSNGTATFTRDAVASGTWSHAKFNDGDCGTLGVDNPKLDLSGGNFTVKIKAKSLGSADATMWVALNKTVGSNLGITHDNKTQVIAKAATNVYTYSFNLTADKNEFDNFSDVEGISFHVNNSESIEIEWIEIGDGAHDVSTNELSTLSNFTLFPSPATSEVNLKFTAQEATTVTLTDITGRVMVSEQVSAGSVSKSYDVSGFAQGLYFVTISGANGQTTEKFMVK